MAARWKAALLAAIFELLDGDRRYPAPAPPNRQHSPAHPSSHHARRLSAGSGGLSQGASDLWRDHGAIFGGDEWIDGNC